MEYIVIYTMPNQLMKTEYIKAPTAQKAVDKVRWSRKDAQIKEVARILKNWK